MFRVVRSISAHTRKRAGCPICVEDPLKKWRSLENTDRYLLVEQGVYLDANSVEAPPVSADEILKNPIGPGLRVAFPDRTSAKES